MAPKPPKKLADEQAKAVEEAEAAAKEHGTGNPAINPENSTTPVPGTTSSDPNEVDVVSTDDATSLNPNVTLSGTKPDGSGGQVLLDTVDPAVANAALLPDQTPPEPQSPSKVPEQTGAAPAEGEVFFEVTADNKPFYSGGPLNKGDRVVMSKEEAEVLVGLNAGKIVGTAAPASDSNAKTEGE